MRFNRPLIVTLVLISLPLLRGEPEMSWNQWAQAQSDIPASPRITFGRLANGLRYALLPNHTPPGQVSMRLLVRAGSLQEQDDEPGYAHFVEHMAFRGTRGFPADEKIKFMQALGMGFGPHVNAETTFTHTLYKLDLPENSAATLASGLRILRDYADGLVFDPAEMDRERGVVLSEALARHNTDQDRDIARFELFFAGTIIPQRWPIGTEASIKRARPAGLRSFYDAWYRPERMVVVIAGDIDPAALAPLLQTSFASLSARAAPRPEPSLGGLAIPDKLAARFLSEPRNGVQSELGTVSLGPRPPDTEQNRLNALRLELANRMLGNRLNRLAIQHEGPISGFNVEEGHTLGRFHQLTVVTVGDDYKWPTVLAMAEQELRRALEHGFDVSELAPVEGGFRTQIQQAAQAAPTAPTGDLANALVGEIDEEQVPVFPDERLTRAMANIDRITAEDCRAALAEAWGGAPRYVFMTASARLIKPTTRQIREKYQESRDAAVAPAASLQAVKFAYEDFGPPGEVVAKEHIADLDFWQVRFANGVRLNLKHTGFEHQAVRLSLRIGSGRLDEPVDRPGLTNWAGAAVIAGGLNKYTDDELMQAMMGAHANFNVNFTSVEDAFQMSISPAAEELPLVLRFTTAYLTDGAFRAEGGKRMTEHLNDFYNNLEQSADGVISQQITPFLAGGDPRVGIPLRKMVQGYSIEKIGSWLRPVFQTGAIEVALVGDFDVDQAIAEVAKTLGSLRARAPKPDLSSRLKLHFPTPPRSQTYTYSTSSKNRPTTLALYWPVNEPVAAADKRRLQLLGLILQDRLRVQIRVEEGETYTPTAQFAWNDTYPGAASLQCRVEVRSDRSQKLTGEIRDVAGNLGKQGVTAEELARARAQCLAAVHQWQTDNGYWVSSVLADAQEHPWRLEIARSYESEFNAATVTEIDALAARFLTEKNLFQFTIKPEYHRP
jgi:zinc protease